MRNWILNRHIADESQIVALEAETLEEVARARMRPGINIRKPSGKKRPNY